MKPFITVCMIGKNEEKYIERSFKSIAALNLPIVYTDTGSTDSTLSIASQYTDNIYHFTWCNDFSAARNFCASQASTNWIWFLDCDEKITNADITVLRNFCQPDNAQYIGTVCQKDLYTLSGEQTYSLTRLGRIYNRIYSQYTGAIHEQIVPKSKKAKATPYYRDLNITVEHDGYLNQETLFTKCERNAELLLKELERKPDPYFYYQLGKCYSTLGKQELAANAFSKGLSFDLDPALFYVRSMVEAYGYCLLDLKEYETALSFENIYDTFCTSADFVFLMGLIYMNNAQFDKAIAQFEKAATFPSCTIEGVNSYRAFYNIGVIYECSGKSDLAKDFYKKCKNYTPATKRLEVLCFENTIS